MSVRPDLEAYLAECVRIEPLAIQEEFVRVPADYAYWNERYRSALELHLRAKAERERVWAGKYIIATESHMANGKPATVDYAKAKVEGDPDYQQAVVESITTEAEVARLRGVLEAIRSKRDCLVSVGAMLRQELEHDPLVRRQAEARRGVRSED